MDGSRKKPPVEAAFCYSLQFPLEIGTPHLVHPKPYNPNVILFVPVGFFENIRFYRLIFFQCNLDGFFLTYVRS